MCRIADSNIYLWAFFLLSVWIAGIIFDVLIESKENWKWKGGDFTSFVDFFAGVYETQFVVHNKYDKRKLKCSDL